MLNKILLFKFSYLSKDDETNQEVILEMYDDSTFRLGNETSGFFGTTKNGYSGFYTLREEKLILQIEKADHYRFHIVDEEPTFYGVDFLEKIECSILNGNTISFLFPASRGEWFVTLKKAD